MVIQKRMFDKCSECCGVPGSYVVIFEIINGDVVIHKRTHTGECPFKCDVCDHSSRNKYDLKVHMRTHTGERMWRLAADFCVKSLPHSVHL